MLDETSKIKALCDSAANSVDISFVTEWLVLQMYLSAPPGSGKKTDNPSREHLTSKAGELKTASATREVVNYLMQLGGAAWAGNKALLERVSTPLACYDNLMTQTGGETPVSHLAGAGFEASMNELRTAPASLKIALTLLKRMFTRDGEYLQCVKGRLGKGAPVAEHENEILKASFPDDWPQLLQALRRADALPEALRADCPLDPEEKEILEKEKAEKEAQEKAAAAGQTAGADEAVGLTASVEREAEVTRASVVAKAVIVNGEPMMPTEGE